MRLIPRAAALVLAATLVCLAPAPAVASPAAPPSPRPRVEAPPASPLLAVQGLADQLVGLVGDWVHSLFAPTDRSGDPDG